MSIDKTAISPTLRSPTRPPIWDDHARAQKRLHWEHLSWPIIAIALFGVAGYLLIPSVGQVSWIILILLTLAGSWLSIPAAAFLGVVTFISYSFWLFGLQLESGVLGSEIIVLSLFPFAPLWLAALRARQIEIVRLDVLLKLPQVRANLDISDLSLLPTKRAIERRLDAYLKEQSPGNERPAIMFRLSIPAMNRKKDILGDRVMQQAIMGLANDLRASLPIGDMIAEDLHDNAALYILSFPKNHDLDGLIQKINKNLISSELTQIDLSWTHITQDKKSIFAMEWCQI